MSVALPRSAFNKRHYDSVNDPEPRSVQRVDLVEMARVSVSSAMRPDNGRERLRTDLLVRRY